MNVDVLTSGIWQTNTTILSHRGACVVADPAYFPRELDAIAARVAELGRAETVVFTHGHWDHVMGHAIFPDAPVTVSAALADLVARDDAVVARYLEDAREFDSRWYVPRPSGHAWPTNLRGLADDEVRDLGGITVRALALPGHSPEGLGLVVDDLLLAGDHLSACEIPFVDDLPAYQATLRRLLALLASEVRRVIPGHGPALTAAQAAQIARADLAYLDQLASAPDPLAVPLPRAADVVGMRDHHRDNCVKLSR